jgi:hypothetical protein
MFEKPYDPGGRALAVQFLGDGPGVARVKFAAEALKNSFVLDGKKQPDQPVERVHPQPFDPSACLNKVCLFLLLWVVFVYLCHVPWIFQMVCRA